MKIDHYCYALQVFFVDHINKKTTWEDPRFLESEYQKRGYDGHTSAFKRKVSYSSFDSFHISFRFKIVITVRALKMLISEGQ